MTDQGYELLERAAPTHVDGRARATSSTSSADDDFAAIGRVMTAVADHLVTRHPEMEIRTQ